MKQNCNKTKNKTTLEIHTSNVAETSYILERRRQSQGISTFNSWPSMMLVGWLMVKMGDQTCYLDAHAQSWPFISINPMVHILGKYGKQTLYNIGFMVTIFLEIIQIFSYIDKL